MFCIYSLRAMPFDGVRLTAPTVLNTKADAYAGIAAAATTPPVGLPAGVLLVVAHGGHKIAFQHPPPPEGDLVHGFDPQVLADLLLNNSALFEQLFDLTMGETRLVGWPLSLQIATPVVGPASTEQQRLRALSVVFVLAARPAEGDAAKYDKALAGCQSAVDVLAHALQREEASGGIVSRHVASGARTLPDGPHTNGQPATAAAAAPDGDDGACITSTAAVLATAGAPADDLEPVHTPAEASGSASAGGAASAAVASEVATVLKAALMALQEAHPRTLRVGAHTDVAICALPPPPPPPRFAAVDGGMPPPPALRPYLALLPLDDVGAISRELPADASPLLVRLVHAANPLRSLEQLADETGIALPMVTDLARHLAAWGKVRPIHPLTTLPRSPVISRDFP